MSSATVEVADSISVSSPASSSETNKPGLFERISTRLERFQKSWGNSLRLRVTVVIICAGIVGIGITGFVITTAMESAIFEQTVHSDLEYFSMKVTAAQDKFSAAESPTTGQAQQVANEVVASMYNPGRGLVGSVLLLSEGQKYSANQIFEPSTASDTQVRALITPEIRSTLEKESANSKNIAWQSVEVPNADGGADPGIIAGAMLQIPNAGNYEIYAVYTLAAQESLLNAMYKVLLASVVVLFLFILILLIIVLRMLLRPIENATKKAELLAEGEFATRMEVRGSDELARLAKAFNQMAASIEEQFTQLERMSQLQTQFVSAVSHELRSPVTTIRMAGQLIFDKREELPAALRRSAELQHDQVNNLDSMLADLLEISRYDAGAMTLTTETVDISELVAKTVASLRPLAQDNGSDTQIITSGETSAEIEIRRIERIIRNLLVNAYEHGEGKPVQIRVVANDTAVAVGVVDFGIGITADQAEHVFDRFWRADSSRVRKTGGTGLGLTIAREDALIHGGSLEASGYLGAGAVFLLIIPKQPGASHIKPLSLSDLLLVYETSQESAAEITAESAGDGAGDSATTGGEDFPEEAQAAAVEEKTAATAGAAVGIDANVDTDPEAQKDSEVSAELDTVVDSEEGRENAQ